MQLLEEEGRKSWASRSLNVLAVLSIVMMGISFVQVFKQYYSQPRDTAHVVKQPLFDDIARQTNTSLDSLIPNKELRDEVISIEQRLQEARTQKQLAYNASQQFPSTDPKRHYADQREAIENALNTIGDDQPGLAAPLREQLERLEMEMPKP